MCCIAVLCGRVVGAESPDIKVDRVGLSVTIEGGQLDDASVAKIVTNVSGLDPVGMTLSRVDVAGKPLHDLFAAVKVTELKVTAITGDVDGLLAEANASPTLVAVSLNEVVLPDAARNVKIDMGHVRGLLVVKMDLRKLFTRYDFSGIESFASGECINCAFGSTYVLPLPHLTAFCVSKPDSGSMTVPIAHLACPALHDINVENSGISDSFTSSLVEAAPHLDWLNVSGNSLKCEFIAKLNRNHPVTVLVAADSLISDNEIKQLPLDTTLQFIILTNTPITDESLLALARIPSLNEFVFEGTRISSRGIGAIISKGTIKGVNLNRTKLTDEELLKTAMSPAASLGGICVEGNLLTDASLDFFEKLKGVQHFMLSGNRFTAKAMARLKARFPQAKIDLN
jgi:hypothetical protein